MKKMILSTILLLAGCMPASQQEVLQLTQAVDGIVPAVQAAVASESESTKAKVGDVLKKVEEVNTAVATAEDPIEAAEKGWEASRAWNPYYGYGVLALGILKLLQGKKKVTTALEEVVIGIEDAKKSGDDKATLRASLNASESTETRKLVKKILA